MCLDDRVSVFGDCAINPNPNAEQLAEIAISSAESSIAFGIEPRIAMLSYSSGASGKGEEVDKVRKATEIVKQKRPDLWSANRHLTKSTTLCWYFFILENQTKMKKLILFLGIFLISLSSSISSSKEKLSSIKKSTSSEDR